MKNIIMAALLALGGGMFVADAYGASEKTVDAIGTLLTQVEAKGAVHVLVEVAAPFIVEAKLAGKAAVQEQRTGVAQAQEAVVGRLVAAGVNTTAVKRFATIPFLAMRVDKAGLQALLTDPSVTSVHEDRLEQPMLYDSVPLIRADEAWAAGATGEGWMVAVLDTGVQASHPFLAGKVVDEGCYSTTSEGESISTCPNGESEQTGVGAGVNCNAEVYGCDHGTFVAGIVAGQNGEYYGSTFDGVAPDAQILSMQVFSYITAEEICGQGSPVPCVRTRESDQLRALERVYALRDTYAIAAVTMSFGGGKYTSVCDDQEPARKLAVDNLRAAGIAVLAPSGNEGYIDGINAPACISSVVSVGSTSIMAGEVDEVSGFSNSVDFLDLLAPGQVILSSGIDGYQSMAGTSYAVPHVAGAWALLRGANPGKTVDEVLTALADTGTPVTDFRGGAVKPRVDVKAALDVIGFGDVNQPPEAVITSPGHGQVFPAGSAVEVMVAVSDSDGAVVRMELYRNGQLDGEDFEAPYPGFSYSAGELPIGTHSFYVIAYDDAGADVQSETVTIEIQNEIPFDYASVYRFYNTATGTHFYTINVGERDAILANLPHYQYEGVGFVAVQQEAVGLSPVYRFYNTATNAHFFTISAEEKAWVEARLPQYLYEGIAWYAALDAGADTSPMYRFYNTDTGTHFYTISEAERDWVKVNLPTMNDEGVAYHAWMP